jgi:hypothetical protein
LRTMEGRGVIRRDGSNPLFVGVYYYVDVLVCG